MKELFTVENPKDESSAVSLTCKECKQQVATDSLQKIVQHIEDEESRYLRDLESYPYQLYTPSSILNQARIRSIFMIETILILVI
jgi:hypothetical protein